jgi:hypothetical protein
MVLGIFLAMNESDQKEAQTPEEFSQTGFAEIADGLIETMPDPQPHAIEAAKKDAESVAENLQEPEQVIEAKPKKRGRPPGVKNSKARKSVIGETSGSNQDKKAIPTIDPGAHGAATAAAQCVFVMGKIVGGDDFTPIVDPESGENEPKMMTDAFYSYFQAKGVKDIPPGAALCMVISTYALRRFTRPSPQLKTRWGRIKDYVSGFFKKKQPKVEVIREQPENARSDSRNDGQRKNNADGKSYPGIPEAAKWPKH